MAKRKKQGKRGKSGQSPAPDANRDFSAEVREAIGAGRGRKALGLLKEARKANVEVDERLTADAYHLRLHEMWDRGQADEARQLFEQVLRPMPAWHRHVPAEERFHRMLALGLDEGWSDYGQDPELDAAMDRVVLTRLRRPQRLAEHPALADDHPLKAQAKSVLDAWSLIDDGRPDEALSLLGGIGRRSPMRGWRAFLQALTAYYAGDDAQMEAARKRIPAGAAVEPMGAWLGELTGPGEASSAAVKRLREQAKGNELKCSLAEIDALVEQNASEKSILAKSEPLLRELLSSGHWQLALQVEGYLFETAGLQSPALEKYSVIASLRNSSLRDCGMVRHEMLAITQSVVEREPKRYDFAPPERAVLLTEIAREWLDLYESEGAEYQDCGQPTEWHPGKVDLAFDVCTACLIRFGLDACRRALRQHPLESTFRVALKLAAYQPELQSAEEFVAAWRDRFPDSVEPLEKAVEFYPRMGKLDAAEEALAELETRRGGSYGTVAVARFDLAVPRALSLCVRGRDVLDEVNEALAPLATGETRWQRVLFDTIRWKACGKARTKRAQQLETVAQHERPLLFWHFCRVMDTTFPKSRLPEAIAAQLDSLDAVIGSLEDLTAIDRPRWKPGPRDIPRMLDKSPGLRQLKTAPAESTARYMDLRPALPLVRSLPGFPSMFELTARFLDADDPRLAARFWGWRAVCYADEAQSHFLTHQTLTCVSDCALVAFSLGLNHPPVLEMLRTHAVDIESLKREAADLSKKRRNEILKRERGRVTMRDLVQAVLPPPPRFEHTHWQTPHPSLPKGIEDCLDLVLLETVGDGPIDSRTLPLLLERLGISVDFELTEIQVERIAERVLDVMDDGFGMMPNELVQRVLVQLQLPDRDRSQGESALVAIIRYELELAQPSRRAQPSPRKQQPELPFESMDPE